MKSKELDLNELEQVAGGAGSIKHAQVISSIPVDVYKEASVTSAVKGKAEPLCSYEFVGYAGKFVKIKYRSGCGFIRGEYVRII